MQKNAKKKKKKNKCKNRDMIRDITYIWDFRLVNDDNKHRQQSIDFVKSYSCKDFDLRTSHLVM